MNRLVSYLQNLQRFGIQPGLERIRALLERAGNPHRQYPHILVGGTNGKGSTCEFAARLLAQNGRKIGLYTSPHLYNWNERIRILPGEGLFEGAISDADLDALFNDALPHIESVAQELGQPTEFEVVTFLGLWHFARQNVDAAVLEVGLGGKWDATNASDPLVSVVTHVALDHMDRLGNTLEEIAADKVCIARPNRWFVTGESNEAVAKVLKVHCDSIAAKFVVASAHVEFKKFAQRHQAQNGLVAQHAVAYFLMETTGETRWIDEDFPSSGSGTAPPGRMETLSENPKLIIDAASNPEGSEVLASHIRDILKIQPQNLILVLGILADKDWRAMTEILAPLAKVVICTQSTSPRALPASQLVDDTHRWNPNVELVPTVREAVERAKQLAAPTDTILVTGSFTTIAEVPRESVS